MKTKITNFTLIFLCSFSVTSYSMENTPRSGLQLSPYDIGYVTLSKPNEIQQAQVLNDESVAFTDKITQCAESKRLRRLECYCLYPEKIAHLKNTYEKLIKLHPAWKDNALLWESTDSSHKVSFGILLGNLRFMLFDTKCPTSPSR